MELALEQDLKEAWHYKRENQHRKNLKTSWSTVDSELRLLNSVSQEGHVRCHSDRWLNSSVRKAWNKTTAFYFEQGAQTTYLEGKGYMCIARRYIASIYEAWRVQCGESLNIEFGHFLANPIRITAQGPRNIREIVAVHQEIYNFAKSHHSSDENYYIQKSYPDVIIVCDRDDTFVEEDWDVVRSLREIALRQTVLVVRISSSEHASLAKLVPHALPSDRADADDLEVVRVSLWIAISYFFDLEKQMEEPQSQKSPIYDDKLNVQTTPKGFDRTVNQSPETWAAAVIAEAKQDGGDFQEKKYSDLEEIGRAIIRIRVRAEGKPSDYDLELEPWSRLLTPGYE